MDQELPLSVVRAVAGRRDARVVETSETPIVTGTIGAATGSVTRISGVLRSGAGEKPFSVIRKVFEPLRSGRHHEAAGDPRHWAYWRRESLAYASGVLINPLGAGLVAPYCYEVIDDSVYLADVVGPPERTDVAAHHLGTWHATAPIPDAPWLAGDQLAQRLAVTELDWSTVDAPSEVQSVWARRHDLMKVLDSVPVVLCHGDFHPGNLIASGDDVTTVLDWGTLGTGAAGFDLAHLALSTLTDPFPYYVDGLQGKVSAEDAHLGYSVTLALVGASRLHWMQTEGVPVPAGYTDFVLGTARLP
ncbi:phosphotransferase family protein [Virgisporangium ochraceum]|uniref:phosphotransferase family protein n=1 Tax=Virgisporangium ochraceum TaxID=65505 RepID=UPI001943430A|nr:phosphotransferase [Virgisporangium ochraceum]